MTLIPRTAAIGCIVFVTCFLLFVQPANSQSSPDIDASAQIAEGIALSGGVVAAVAEFYLDKGRFPESNSEAGVLEPSGISSQFVFSVTVEPTTGAIKIEFGNSADASISGRILKLEPQLQESGRRPIWKCSSQYIPEEIWPEKCEI